LGAHVSKNRTWALAEATTFRSRARFSTCWRGNPDARKEEEHDKKEFCKEKIDWEEIRS
jgi:hypothetical protein